MKEKEQIIEALREKGIDFNPNARIDSLKKKLEEASSVPTPPATAEANTDTEESTSADVSKKEEKEPSMLELMKGISATLGNLDTRISRLEGSSSSEYKLKAKTEDIEAAQEMKNKVEDPRIIQIVEESLGTDFGVEIKPFGDKPGFLFSIIVPQRLSDNVQGSRPVIDKETGQNKKDVHGNVIFEDYFPVDRRSRAIGSAQSYDAIKDHCDKVRSYIVSYYQKMSKPLPEFRVK